MELPNVGQQCSHPDCKQLDFLPLICKCGKQFCSDHFNLHIACCETSQNVEVEPKKIENTYTCSRDDCNDTSLVPLICDKCHKHFCIKHRHITQCGEVDQQLIAAEKERQAVPVRQFNEAKIAVDVMIENNLKQAKKRGKNNNLVNKVQLMKIKNKAKGLKTIPVSERVFFNVTYPQNGEDHPVFVSKSWSLGRAIDAIADECKLKNDNNKNTEKKLRLFKKESGEIVSKILSDVLHVLIDNGVIMDGENLVIEYVSDDCQFLNSVE